MEVLFTINYTENKMRMNVFRKVKNKFEQFACMSGKKSMSSTGSGVWIGNMQPVTKLGTVQRNMKRIK